MSQSRPQELTVEEHVQGVLARDRVILGRTITLIESNALKHQQKAQEVLMRLLPHTEKSIRVGVTGVPGAGKSSLIETLGSKLCREGRRVAVLAVDPSSTVTRGSILGDKTRMEQLSQFENSFIRPSPTGGTLGGVSRKTREAMLICEAAGFDIILIETVGVGQSEGAVRSMVDFFLLLTLTGAGDELQNIKKGVLELADAIVIAKADGENEVAARKMEGEINLLLHYLRPDTSPHAVKAYTCSALNSAGIEEIWQVIEGFTDAAKGSGDFERRRREQLLSWMEALIMEGLQHSFLENRAVSGELPQMRENVLSGALTAKAGADKLLELFFTDLREGRNNDQEDRSHRNSR